MKSFILAISKRLDDYRKFDLEDYKNRTLKAKAKEFKQIFDQCEDYLEENSEDLKNLFYYCFIYHRNVKFRVERDLEDIEER